ncbi:unnamed protein product [Protopolystoma xenopodis]|uniref:Uncharacterized protein n=1 Tax=Protopolystoma xenopodis TaxID=117903 RepID=A0A448WXI3_9PLAT|nr:unnamed protein product [Protopolystoma xenopodis]
MGRRRQAVGSRGRRLAARANQNTTGRHRALTRGLIGPWSGRPALLAPLIGPCVAAWLRRCVSLSARRPERLSLTGQVCCVGGRRRTGSVGRVNFVKPSSFRPGVQRRPLLAPSFRAPLPPRPQHPGANCFRPSPSTPLHVPLRTFSCTGSCVYLRSGRSGRPARLVQHSSQAVSTAYSPIAPPASMFVCVCACLSPSPSITPSLPRGLSLSA